MLLTQKFHSLQEIDPEFIPALEMLMHEHWINFAAWKEAEAQGPSDTTFIYWLFFGPTQNSPIGMAQVSLKKINTDTILPWWRKITKMVDKKLDQWKIAHWQLGMGLDGAAVFDQRFARSGQEKLLPLIKELEARDDIMAMSLSSPLPISHRPAWNDIHHEAVHSWQVLRPWERQHKSYQDYLLSLPAEVAKKIQQSWKRLHKDVLVTLGDFPTIEARQELLTQAPQFDAAMYASLVGGLLTFQKNGQVLGLLHYQESQQGVLFVEPMPLEPQGAELVSDGCYVQYALLKAHELPSVRKVVILRQQMPLRLNTPEESDFFKEHGFPSRQINEHDWSRSAFIK